MSAPLVSVPMITYNHASFIAQAIEGVLRQETGYPFELIIGEDCSSDETRLIVAEYQKKYPEVIRVLTSEKNVGMKTNVRRTFKACRGTYIACCEGDDFWQNPHKLQLQTEYLERHPDCGLVYSSYDVYHVGDKRLIRDFINYKELKMPENPSLSDIIEGKSKPLTCTVMARRSLCEEITAADSFLHKGDHFLMGDTQLWAELATRARLHYIPESLATHNITGESASRSSNLGKVLRFEKSGAELRLYLCKKHNVSLELREKCEFGYAEATLRLAAHEQNRDAADEIRRMRKKLTLKQWVHYCGARNVIAHRLHRAMVWGIGLQRKPHDQWT